MEVQSRCLQRNTRTAAIGISMLALVMSVLVGCEAKRPPPPSKGGTTTRTPEPAPAPQRTANLRIATIEVFPRQPRAGTRFTANVYIENAGNAASGEYDLALHVKDVTHGGSYPIGTFRKPSLRPGERIAAFTKNDLMVNSAGAHQLWVEIKPFGFADANAKDNSQGWAFNAVE